MIVVFEGGLVEFWGYGMYRWDVLWMGRWLFSCIFSYGVVVRSSIFVGKELERFFRFVYILVRDFVLKNFYCVKDFYF